MKAKYRVPKEGEIFKHYKGTRYQVISMATHAETMEELVIYQALNEDGRVYARTIDSFMGELNSSSVQDEYTKNRFSLEEQSAISDSRYKTLISDFLDCKNNIEKIEFIQHHKEDITDSMLETIAQCLDFTERDEDKALRIQAIIKYLQTMEKYEGARIRS